MKCDHICKICGKHETGSWIDEAAKEFTEKQMCHTCSFWDEKTNPESGFLIIDGVSYRALPEEPPGGWRGFGGRKHKIKKANGEIITTTNLWCQGHVPKGYWRSQLPDNAEFVKID